VDILTFKLSNARCAYVHRQIVENQPGGWWVVDTIGFKKEARFLRALDREALDSYAAAGAIIASRLPFTADGASLGRSLRAIHASGSSISAGLEVFRVLSPEKACAVLEDGVPLEYIHAF
jgi:hypothetical protein